MARKEQTGSGGARGERVGSAHHGHRARKTRQARGKGKARRAATHATHPITTVGEHPTAGSVWSGAATAGSPAPLLTLTPATPATPAQADALLTLTGAERGALHEALHAWGAARDQAANLAWRRPGGLTRMAGL